MKSLRLLAIVFIIAITGSLFVGCSSDNSAKTTTTEKTSETPYETKEMTCNDPIVSTEIFQVVKPDGWLGIRQYDTTQYPVNNTYPVDETKLCLTKGGTDEYDSYTLPSVFVYYEDSIIKMEDIIQYYSAYQYLDNITINGVSCEACLAAMDDYSSDDESYYMYGIVLYPISDHETIEFTVTVSYPDGSGIEMDDPDVVAILNGVTLIK